MNSKVRFAGVVAIGLTVYCLPFTPTAEAADLAENQARMGAVEGDVGYLPQGSDEWLEAHEGLPLEPGDQIRTAEDSRVELQMSENVLWILQPDTQAVTERTDSRSGRLHLTAGSLLGKVDSSRVPIQQQWEFSTPAALIAVRGTEFALQFSPVDGTRLAVYEGLVEMQAAETAAGEEPVERIGANHEGWARRGHPLAMLPSISPGMNRFRESRPDLRKRLARQQQGWSIWNPEDRKELRKKMVPAIKTRKKSSRPATTRKRRRRSS